MWRDCVRRSRPDCPWLSQDGLRQWRMPSYKPQLGKWQSDFESRWEPSGQWQANGHLDILDLP